MHLANESSSAIWARWYCWVVWSCPLPAGSRCLQARLAAWNRGLLASASRWMVNLKPPGSACGSGKFATPLERMHCAYATSRFCGDDAAPFCVADAAPFSVVEAAAVVEEARLATPGERPPPPQPAASSAS